ncbi:hypothetical protein D3C76_1697620 [compost metagenome]
MDDADCAIDQGQRQPQHDETVGEDLAGEADFLADGEHQGEQDQAEGDDDRRVHGEIHPSDFCCLLSRLRGVWLSIVKPTHH